MTTLLVARHGQTDWNQERRWLGQADRPLTDLGLEQARELGRTLAGTELDAAYSSDLSRAVRTAEIALAGRGLAVTPRRELRERFLGSWEGLLGDEIPGRFPELFARYQAGTGFGAEDAESFDSVAERVHAAVRRIAHEHPSATVLVVTHSGPLRVLAAWAAGIDFTVARRSLPEPAHGAVARYVWTGDGIRTAV